MNKMMSLLTRMSERRRPVIRLSGPRKARVLALHLPGDDDGALMTMPVQKWSDATFRIVGLGAVYELRCNGVTIASFATRDETCDVVAAILARIAPSRWRWVRRGALILLVYWLFSTPSAPRAPHAYARAGAPVQQGQQGQMVGPGAPGASAEAADPFGLRLAEPAAR